MGDFMGVRRTGSAFVRRELQPRNYAAVAGRFGTESAEIHAP